MGIAGAADRGRVELPMAPGWPPATAAFCFVSVAEDWANAGTAPKSPTIATHSVKDFRMIILLVVQ